MNVPAKLELSGPIDRDGAGETPAVGSSYRLVQAIPRGPACRYQNGPSEWGFLGGPPRCPVCLTSSLNRVQFNGRHSKLPSGDFHCRKCLVTWRDTDETTCYICDATYQAELGTLAAFFRGHFTKHTGTCYHCNVIAHPFCARCEFIIGEDVNHGRRQLRRMVGLRAPLTVLKGGKG